ncbi:hypothetical protein CR513_19638, partial [Mucuna pruriens]
MWTQLPMTIAYGSCSVLLKMARLDAILKHHGTKRSEVRMEVNDGGYVCAVHILSRFIKGFSKIVAPLTQLIWKDQSFTWTKKCKKIFQEWKKRLTTSPILVLLDPRKGTVVKFIKRDII